VERCKCGFLTTVPNHCGVANTNPAGTKPPYVVACDHAANVPACVVGWCVYVWASGGWVVVGFFLTANRSQSSKP
jgi:hypothetical protein